MEKALKKHAPIFVLPTFLAFVIGFIIPFAQGFYLSFCKFTTVGNATFVGISNYTAAIKDTSFTSSFKFTVLFAIVSILLINVLAFGLALLLTQKLKGTNIFRTVFFMPNLIGGIVLGYIWQILINCVLSIVGKLSAYDHRSAAPGTEFFSRLLGTYHFDVLAADRIYDDHLHRRSSECTG